MKLPFFCNLNKVTFGDYLINGSCAIDGSGNFQPGRFYIYGPNRSAHVVPTGLVVSQNGDSVTATVLLPNGDEIRANGKMYEGARSGIASPAVASLVVDGETVQPVEA